MVNQPSVTINSFKRQNKDIMNKSDGYNSANCGQQIKGFQQYFCIHI